MKSKMLWGTLANLAYASSTSSNSKKIDYSYQRSQINKCTLELANISRNLNNLKVLGNSFLKIDNKNYGDSEITSAISEIKSIQNELVSIASSLK